MAIGDVKAYKNQSGTEVFSLDQSGNLTIAGTLTSSGASADDFGAVGIKADVIAESTAAAGVTVDGLLLKDGFVVAVDAQGVKLGTGVDDTISHDGTLTTWTHTTGDLLIDNTDVDDQIVFRVGTDTTATGIEFRNDSDVAMWAVSPSSASAGTLTGLDGSALVLGNGADDSVLHNGTATIWTHTTGELQFTSTDVNEGFTFKAGTATSATWFRVLDSADEVQFRVTMDGQADFIGNLDATGGVDIDADSVALTLGASADLSITHDGTDTIVDSVNATAKLALRTGTDTSATQVDIRNDSNSPMFIVTGAGLVTLADGTTLQRLGAGTGTGDVIERIGATTSEGMEVRVYEATVSPSAIETALFTVPANNVIDSVQANVQTALTGGGTTVTFGIGITGDVDLYGTAFSGGSQADLLTQNAKINAIGTKSNAGAGIGAYNASTVALKLIGAATGGTAAGDTALTVGSVRVVVRYRVLIDLANA